MHTLDYNTYSYKLKHCYMGKAIGGTLGLPLEGVIGTREVTYYDPVPETMLENDDIDMQVVCLEAIRRRGLPINRRDLAESWLDHVRGVYDEYGAATYNLRTGIYPPMSGYANNKFFAGMGAAIRSEFWAALAPGDPELAVRLAREDACVDHCGDGMEAEVFLTALESAAFVESDRDTLIEIALRFISPENCLCKALKDVKMWWNKTHDVYAVREKVLCKYYNQNWTNVVINLSYILLAWYAGEGDFSKSICIVAGLGHDADCTTATLGALLGILSEKEFEERWTKPLGNRLVLSSCMSCMHEVATIDDFCDQLTELCCDVQVFYDSKTRIEGASYRKLEEIYSWGNESAVKDLGEKYNLRESLVSVRPLMIKILYPEIISLNSGETAEYIIEVSEPKQQNTDVLLEFHLPYGWDIHPKKVSVNIDGIEGYRIPVKITAPKNCSKKIPLNQLDINVTVGALTWCVSAGIPQAIDCWCSDCEAFPESCPQETDFGQKQRFTSRMIYNTIPEGGKLFCMEFRPTCVQSEAILVAQGSGEMKVWIDGKPILQHDGFEYVPAFHRSDYISVLHNLSDTWHRMYIWIGAKDAERTESNPKNARVPVEHSVSVLAQRRKYDTGRLDSPEEREMFIGFAERAGWQWIWEMEWRVPKL